jgi:hypothetical protein
MSFDSNNNEYRNDHLQELSGSDYEIVDGEPNIKNWDVKTEQGVKLAKLQTCFSTRNRARCVT